MLPLRDYELVKLQKGKKEEETGLLIVSRKDFYSSNTIQKC